MKTVVVAGVTLRELLRRKVQVNLLLFGVLLILASSAVSTLTLGHMHRILSDLGLTAMALIGTLLAVFLGASLVAGDVERRVVYPVIAKPVSRSAYLLGRYAGLAVALLLNLAVMAVFLAALLALDARGLDPVNGTLGAAVLAMGVQLLVVGAVAVLFSAITTPTLASIFALALAMAGHLTNDMRAFWRGAEWVASAIWYLVPNLSALSLNEAVIYRTAVPEGTWVAALYGLLYAGAMLALAAFAFERRDLR
jgi:ABC-type transport system involved in multi-copper enzyme maturation permease subunit